MAAHGFITLPTSPDSSFLIPAGFNPGIMFFFATARTTDGASATNRIHFGATDGINQGTASGRDKDNEATAETIGMWKDDKCALLFNSSNDSIQYEIQHVAKASWTSAGGLINITNAPGTAFRLGWFALTEQEARNVVILDKTLSTGAFDDIDFGADMDCVIGITALTGAATGVADTDNQDMSIGFWDRTTQCCVGITSNGNSAEADCFRSGSNSKFMREIEDDGTLLGESTISNIVNGVKLTHNDTYDEAHRIIMIGIKGIKCKVTTKQVPGTAPTDFDVTDAGFTPVGGLVITQSDVVVTSNITTELRLSIGAFAIAGGHSEGVYSQDNADPTNTVRMADDDTIWVRNNQANTITATARAKEVIAGQGQRFTQTLATNTDQIFLFIILFGVAALPIRHYPRGSERGTLRGVY